MSKCCACKNCVYEDPAYQEALEKVKKNNPKLITEQDKANLKKEDMRE